MAGTSSWIITLVFFFFVGVQGKKYLGCYHDIAVNEHVMTGGAVQSKGSMTNDKCIEHCKSKKMAYAATRQSYKCFCSESRPPLEMTAEEEECDSPCDGDRREMCGSRLRLSLYDTSDASRALFRAVGCFRKSGSPVLRGPKVRSSHVTPQYCAELCFSAGYRYAGLQSSSDCTCGSSVDASAKTNDGECSAQCSGDTTQKCGGENSLSVLYTGLPGLDGSRYLGCFRDISLVKRVMPEEMAVFKGELTTAKCISHCRSKNFKYAGTEWKFECFCSNTPPPYQLKVEESACDEPCDGNKKEICGGNVRMSVYQIAEEGEPKNEGVAVGTRHLGCFWNSAETPLLGGPKKESTEMTGEHCTTFCYNKGFTYAGLQFGKECICGGTVDLARQVEESRCSLQCSGDRRQKCGGTWTVNLHRTGLPEVVSTRYVGCFRELGLNNRIMTGDAAVFKGTLTTAKCINHCRSKNFRYAGTQWSYECFCSKTLPSIKFRVDDVECNVACAGNDEEICGGNVRMSVYDLSDVKVPHVAVKHFGCFENAPDHLLLEGPRMESFQLTPEYCAGVCIAKDYSYAGLYRGKVCYCGDKVNRKRQLEDNACNTQCSGDRSQVCGGAHTMNVYLTGLNDVNVGPPHDQGPLPPPAPACQISLTVLNGRAACKNQVLLTEDFSSGRLDTSAWAYSIFMPLEPDYEFTVFDKNPKNIYIRDGKLFIKPTILDDETVRTGTKNLVGCTGDKNSDECSREAVSFHIVPPVESARINTKDSLSFKYGKVVVRAKMPKGDWLKPEVELRPTKEEYGPDYSSGLMRLAMARGNDNLAEGYTDISYRLLQMGALLGSQGDVKSKVFKEEPPLVSRGSPWHDGFHNYTLRWTPDNIYFQVDDRKEHALIVTQGGKLADLVGFNQNKVKNWQDGSNIAPFDKEFYISIGLSAGGMRDFPDDSFGGGCSKPWKDREVKAMLKFWNDRERWERTWDGEESALQVDFVQVTAL